METQLLQDMNYFEDGIEAREKVSQFLSPGIVQTGLDCCYQRIFVFS